MTDKKTEALKLAQQALEELLAEKSYWWQEVERDIVKALEKAESICKQALAEQPANQLDDTNVADIPKIGCVNHDCDKCKAQPQQEPVAIYYMRDNHTFKKLSANVSTALVEIEQEFNEGYTHGTLCSKRKGFRDVHASGSVNRMKFFADCKAALEQWLPKSPPASKPLTDEEIEKTAEQVGMFIDKYGLAIDAQNGLEDGVDIFGFARAIEAKLKEKNQWK